MINLEVANEAVDTKVDDLIPDGSRVFFGLSFTEKTKGRDESTKEIL